MQDELQALDKTCTWDLVDLPAGKPLVGCKWVYKIKTQSDGSVERYKARLVVKGFTQEYGIDYEETFAPVSCPTSIHSLITFAAAKRWKLFHMDVKNDFLNGIHDLKQFLSHKFEMKNLGVLTYFLGFEVTSSDDGYLLSQTKYASNLISKAGVTDSETGSTPLEPNV
ncbi:hypothetical protein SLEP1_g37048 [Rubroshorea leprosula]|uniref:Reverse transcriptase Ty1/copia-type domain-containing protein n=1 Tax=Rubroshorea leprosula TaxID=152421 RepID=A0AAV5KTY1_9ROSI|nr:hypothetical protein SLEP1_g37048 [Rubroshorea leprosula]